MKADVDYLHTLLGEDVLLLPVRKGTKKPIGKWGNLTIAAMSDPDYLAKLNRAANIGVALGRVSGGLCSIDIDVDDWVEPFLRMNPLLRDTTCTKGARGCNFWVRITGDYPRTHHLKQDGASFGEFRSNGSQTIIHGTHPDGCAYQIVNDSPPIELAYADLKWFEKSKQQPPANSSSVILNSVICTLNSNDCTLYNTANDHRDDTHDTASVLASIASRKAATASFQRAYPTVLAELYADFIENRFRAIAGAHNTFLTESIPFLFRAVSPTYILPLVQHFYRCNQSMFNDSLEDHMEEARGMTVGVSASYINDLGEGERDIYTALNEREQNLFRLSRDLALTNAEKGGGRTFFAPMDKFGWRLGLKGMQVGRDLKTLEGYGIIRCIEKGKPWAKGTRALAGTYAWLLA